MRSLSCLRADDRLRIEPRYGSCSSMNLIRFMNAERCERVLCGSGAAISRRSKSGILAMRATLFLVWFNGRHHTKLARNLHVMKERNTIDGGHIEILEGKTVAKNQRNCEIQLTGWSLRVAVAVAASANPSWDRSLTRLRQIQ